MQVDGLGASGGDAKARLAYSVFQQGAGLINAHDARMKRRRDCANRGLDIEKDLAGTEHYGGPARQSEDDGDYYIADAERLRLESRLCLEPGLCLESGLRLESGLCLESGLRVESERVRVAGAGSVAAGHSS